MRANQNNQSGRDVLKAIRQSLSFKLSLAVGLIFLVAVLAFTYYLLSLQEEQVFERMVLNVSQFSDTVKRGTHYSMLKNQRESLHKIIEAIGDQPGVEKIRVFNKTGAIMFASHKEDWHQRRSPGRGLLRLSPEGSTTRALEHERPDPYL